MVMDSFLSEIKDHKIPLSDPWLGVGSLENNIFLFQNDSFLRQPFNVIGKK